MAIVVALMPLGALTACGLNHDAQVAYDYAKEIDVCEYIAGSNEVLGVPIVLEVTGMVHPELSTEDIEAGVRKAAAEC